MDWKNSETQKVALGFFDMFDFQDHPWLDSSSVKEVSDYVQDVAKQVISATTLDLSKVSWSQIAKHLMQAQEV
jgi:hypothetical protein